MRDSAAEALIEDVEEVAVGRHLQRGGGIGGDGGHGALSVGDLASGGGGDVADGDGAAEGLDRVHDVVAKQLGELLGLDAASRGGHPLDELAAEEGRAGRGETRFARGERADADGRARGESGS